MPIPVLIVSGFLGGGKTSFVRHLLPLCGELGLRPALIINEVGEVDVDGALLADLHAEQARLVGGCVCCTLQSQLADTLFDLLDRQAMDLIIIECSGVSNPLDVVGVLSIPALMRQVAVSHIITLLDTYRAQKMLNAAEVARTQLAAADIIILNKADKLSPDHKPEITALARTYAPRAIMHWANHGDIGRDSLTQLLRDPAPVRHRCGCGHHHHEHECDHEHTHALPASFCTVAIPLPEQVERASLQQVMQSLPANVLRAKGFARTPEDGWLVLHRVYDAIDLTPFTGPTPSLGAFLVCIGQHLDAAAITEEVTTMLNG